MSTNLNAPQVAANQAQKEVTINDATGVLDAALTEEIVIDMSGGSVVVSGTIFRQAMHYEIDGVAGPGLTVTLTPVKRFAIFSSDSLNTDPVDIIMGLTTYTMQPGESQMFYTDGSADGLKQLALTAPNAITPGVFTRVTVTSQGLVSFGDDAQASDMEVSRIGASTYSNVQHLMNFSLSPGLTSGGTITASGTANCVDVAIGTGCIKATDSNVATLSFFDWPASVALSTPSNTTRYIGVVYNAGTPQVVARTTDVWDLDTEFPLGIVVNEGGTRHITNVPWTSGDNMANIIERIDSLANIARCNREGGLILSNSGVRNVAVSAGQLFSRMDEFPIAAVNTAVSGTFDAYYRDGVGGFTKQAGLTQWDNTKYDDGTGVLATLTAGHYVSRWFYLMLDGSVAMIYGRADDATLADAQNEGTPSTVPDRISKQGMLIGRFIVLKSAAAPAVTQTVFEVEFSSSGVTQFSDLAGTVTPAQGGTGIVNNNASTTTISGNFAYTMTLTGITNVTFPVTGTLAVVGHTHVAADVTNFDEAVDDRVAIVIQNAGGIRVSYNDAGNAITLNTAFSTQLFHVEDRKAQNVAGGTFTAGAWRTRDLNTSMTNEITGASLAANQLTLPAGTYWCEFRSPAHDNANNVHQARVQNITGAATLLLGSSASFGSTGGRDSVGSGRFTLAVPSVVELQGQISVTQAVDGFGSPANFTTEVYSVIRVWKIS